MNSAKSKAPGAKSRRNRKSRKSKKPVVAAIVKEPEVRNVVEEPKPKVLNVLFVGTSPEMYYHTHHIYFADHFDILDQLQSKFSKTRSAKEIRKLYKIITGAVKRRDEQEKPLDLYLGDINENDDIRQLFVSKYKKIHDLDSDRETICDILKRLYPNTNVKYSTCDMWQIGSHKDPVIAEGIVRNDKIAFNKSGVRMKFIDHHNTKFQRHIQNTKLEMAYDIVWFFNCTHPHYVIDKNNLYIDMFKCVLKDDGLVIHSDIGNTYFRKKDIFRSELMGFMDRYDQISHFEIKRNGEIADKVNRDTIQFLLDELIEIEPGVYKFK